MAKIGKRLVTLLALVALRQLVVFKMNKLNETRCFIVRSEFARGANVSFSYVVHSDIYGFNQIHFTLQKKDSAEIINEVQPEDNSSQRIFKFDNDGESVYRACFRNPNEYTKNVKFYVENRRKESIAEKGRLAASKRMAGDLKSAIVGIEEQMFATYLNLKYTEESLTESQGFLKLAMIFKFSVMAFVAVLQSFCVAKLLGKLRVSFSDII